LPFALPLRRGLQRLQRLFLFLKSRPARTDPAFVLTRKETTNMSCWVVPTVAAELWGIPVDNILHQIRNGSLASKHENGFTFIDVAPHSPVMERPKALRQPPPPTYRVVSHEEFQALVGDMMTEDEDVMENWRIGRSEAGRMRRPPEAPPEAIAA
jgi:hypothetical protein